MVEKAATDASGAGWLRAIDVRAQVQTDDGAIIYIRYRGQ